MNTWGLLVKSGLNFIATHAYFYFFLIIVQMAFFNLYIYNLIFCLAKNTILIFLLKISYFIHGVYGTLTIIEDYTFNKLCRIVFLFLLNIISIKSFLILFSIGL